MKTLIAVGFLMAAACGLAVESSPSLVERLSSVFISSSSDEVDDEALKDNAISRIYQQLKEMKAKYEDAKSAGSDEIEALKKKIAELREDLAKKVKEFKAEQQKKLDEARVKREATAEKAKKTDEDVDDDADDDADVDDDSGDDADDDDDSKSAGKSGFVRGLLNLIR